MHTDYQHTQFGYVTTVCLGGSLVLCIAIYWMLSFNPALLIPTSLVLVALLLFPSLTVRVTEQHLKCTFGWGLIHRTILLSDIQTVEAVTNRWYWGWGIRLTPRGWLWNVSGLEAIEVTFQNGKHFRIGTDDAIRLSTALERAIGSK